MLILLASVIPMIAKLPVLSFSSTSHNAVGYCSKSARVANKIMYQDGNVTDFIQIVFEL